MPVGFAAEKVEIVVELDLVLERQLAASRVLRPERQVGERQLGNQEGIRTPDQEVPVHLDPVHSAVLAVPILGVGAGSGRMSQGLAEACLTLWIQADCQICWRGSLHSTTSFQHLVPNARLEQVVSEPVIPP